MYEEKDELLSWSREKEEDAEEDEREIVNANGLQPVQCCINRV